MVFASGTEVQLAYLRQTAVGTAESDSLKYLRATSRNINLTKNILESSEVLSSRQESDVRHGLQSVVGSPAGQLSLVDFDDFFEFGLQNSFDATAASLDSSPTITSNSTGTKFLRVAGSFITDGYRVGDVITVAGLTAGNNGDWTVTAVAALELTVDDPGLAIVTDGTGAADAIADINRLDPGTDLAGNHFTVERRFESLDRHQLFTDVCLNGFTINASTEQIATISLDMLGITAGSFTGTETTNVVTNSNPNSPMSGFEGSLHIEGSAAACVTSIEFTVTNNLTTGSCVGSVATPAIFNGTMNVSGSMTVYFENSVQYDAFKNESESVLVLKLEDPTSSTSFLNFVMGRVKYTGADIDPPQEGPVPIVIPFRALYGSATQPALTIQKTNA